MFSWRYASLSPCFEYNGHTETSVRCVAYNCTILNVQEKNFLSAAQSENRIPGFVLNFPLFNYVHSFRGRKKETRVMSTDGKSRESLNSTKKMYLAQGKIYWAKLSATQTKPVQLIDWIFNKGYVEVYHVKA